MVPAFPFFSFTVNSAACTMLECLLLCFAGVEIPSTAVPVCFPAVGGMCYGCYSSFSFFECDVMLCLYYTAILSVCFFLVLYGASFLFCLLLLLPLYGWSLSAFCDHDPTSLGACLSCMGLCLCCLEVCGGPALLLAWNSWNGGPA